MDIVEILRDKRLRCGRRGGGRVRPRCALATELRPGSRHHGHPHASVGWHRGGEASEREPHRPRGAVSPAFSQKELVDQATRGGRSGLRRESRFTPNDLLPAIEIALSRYQQILTLESRGRRPGGALRDPQARRPREGPPERAHGLERTGGVPLDPEGVDGSPHDDAGGRAVRSSSSCSPKKDAAAKKPAAADDYRRLTRLGSLGPNRYWSRSRLVMRAVGQSGGRPHPS